MGERSECDGRDRRAGWEGERARALSPCAEESGTCDSDASDDRGRTASVPASWRERWTGAVGRWWTGLYGRVRSDTRGWARDALECVGATLFVVWLVLRWYRLHETDVPDFLQ